MLFAYHPDSRGLSNDGTPNLLIDIITRYDIDSQTVQRILLTIDKDEEQRRALMQELVDTGKIQAKHREVKDADFPPGWTALASRSIEGQISDSHKQHGCWNSKEEVNAIASCNIHDRWRIQLVDEGPWRGVVIAAYTTKCMRVLFSKRTERAMNREMSVRTSGWKTYYSPSQLYRRGQEFSKEPMIPDEEVINELERLKSRLKVVETTLRANSSKLLVKEKQSLQKQIEKMTRRKAKLENKSKRLSNR